MRVRLLGNGVIVLFSVVLFDFIFGVSSSVQFFCNVFLAVKQKAMFLRKT